MKGYRFDQFEENSVKAYRYRKAIVGNVLFRAPRQDFENLEKALAAASGVNIDNHTAYAVTTEKGDSLYISFSDSTASFGMSIEEKDW